MLPRVIAISVPVLIVFGSSAVAFAKERTLMALIQLAGAVCLLVVIVAHFSEAVDYFPSMGWGRPNTPGHYVDLLSVIAGLILLVVGYLSRRFLRRKISN